MKEDIEILEERVITLKRHIKYYEESDCKTNVYQQLVKECQATENLLTRYKQLEEENKRLNNHNIIGRIDAIKIEDLEPVLKPYYIPKAKVEEKIDDFKRCGGSNGRDETENLIRGILIEVLEELLRRRGEIRCVSIFFHTMLLRTELIV